MAGRRRANSVKDAIERVESDPAHHLAGPFTPQTPLETPRATPPPAFKGPPKGGFLSDVRTGRWVSNPSSSLKLVLIPLVLDQLWRVLLPQNPSPFAPFIFISNPVHDGLYAKSYWDLAFVAYYVVVWCFVRQAIILKICWPLARKVGFRGAKRERFGEQGYAFVYFGFFGLWGIRVMSQLPTWWYQTEYFFVGYPEWALKPELKRYYLMQGAYWLQQLLVMLSGLEKPRKDFRELVAHHAVTLHLIFWSYLVNMSWCGNAVFLSMDVPDTFLAASKILNYLQWETPKTIVFAVFIPIWTYFRLYLNGVITWSMWSQFELMPEATRKWYRPEGVWMTWWMRYQMIGPMLVLLGLNLFWYFLILRIAKRAIFNPDRFTDDRSDDEGDDDDDDDEKDD